MTATEPRPRAVGWDADAALGAMAAAHDVVAARRIRPNHPSLVESIRRTVAAWTRGDLTGVRAGAADTAATAATLPIGSFDWNPRTARPATPPTPPSGPRRKSHRVECVVEQDEVEDEAGDLRAGVCATCGRCGQTATSVGTGSGSVTRALVLLREGCQMGESNYYVAARGVAP